MASFADLLRLELAKSDENPDNEGYNVPKASMAGNGMLVARQAMGIPPELKQSIVPAIQQRLQQLVPQQNPLPRPPAALSDSAGPSAAQAPSDAVPGQAQMAGYSADALKQMLAAQFAGVKQADDAVAKYENKPQQMNLAPFLSYVDSVTGSKFTPGYKAPETPDERAQTVAGLRDKALQRRQQLTSDYLGTFKTSTNADQKMYSDMFRTLASQFGNDQRASAASEKELDRQAREMRTVMDPTRASTRNAVGKAIDRKESINRLFALSTAQPDFNMDGREMEDFATGLAGVISAGGNITADAKIERLLPKTGIGKFKTWVEWIRNEPQGLEQQKFVKRMLRDVIAENENSTERLNAYAEGKSKAFQKFRRERSDEYDDNMAMWGRLTQTPKLYEQMKARLDAEDLAEKEAKKGKRPAPAAAAAAPGGDGKVTVQFKGRTLRINPADLPQAVKDGAVEVK